MASMLSKTTVERILLPRFCELCGDGKLFQVRKVGMASFITELFQMHLHSLTVTSVQISFKPAIDG